MITDWKFQINNISMLTPNVYKSTIKLFSQFRSELNSTYITVLCNTYSSRKMSSWNLESSKLNLKSPVPSDIQVVRDHVPKKISVLASEIGLTEDEYSPYGHQVAKGI